MAEQAKEVYDLEKEVEKEPFESGFNITTIAASLFVAIIMMPAAIYMGLMVGQGVGGAAQWVTMILFLEMAKRSLRPLKKQEIFMIHNMVGATMAAGAVLGAATLVLPGGIFSSFVWNAYLKQSPYAEGFGLTPHIPKWACPPMGSEALRERTFLHKDWFIPGLLLVVNAVMAKAGQYSMGYAIFRYTSDIERLEFPMAPIAAQGTMALAESGAGKETWRWRIFSIGGMIGLVFGLLYVAVPAITGTMMSEPFMILPIPFFDATDEISNFLPCGMLGLSTNIGLLFTGFILPFWVIMGMFVGSVVSGVVANPLLYKYTDIMKSWSPGMSAIPTNTATRMDFWIPYCIGFGILVAFVGIWKTINAFRKTKKGSGQGAKTPPPGRGDCPIWMALAGYYVVTIFYLWLIHILVPDFPLWILAFFGFILSPLLSYINGRMVGLTGGYGGVGFPYLFEYLVVLSGYEGAKIWFAPSIAHPGGPSGFKIAELTRTKFSSLIKLGFTALGITTVFSFVFWHLIWRMGPIPSSAYPYINRFWPMHAIMKSLWATLYLEGGPKFMLESITRWQFILWGFGSGLFLFSFLTVLKLPILFFYGIVGGIAPLPHQVMPMFIGALLARFYLGRKFGGYETFRKKYAPVFLAGFGCGMGLIGMASISLVLIAKTVTALIF